MKESCEVYGRNNELNFKYLDYNDGTLLSMVNGNEGYTDAENKTSVDTPSGK